ncbi:M61 family metallopeptidase [Burkholderiaceae bacterium UC74_6]
MLHYRVDLSERLAHDYLLTLTLDAPAAGQVFSLPSWIPGSYLLREFAKQLSELRAEQGGAAVPVQQLDKSSWRVDCTAGEPLTLHYRVHAFDTSVRTAWLDARRGFFNGTSLFLRAHGHEDQPHGIAINDLPEGWKIATALNELRAANYDELVDSPVELGEFWSGEFQAGGVTHQIAVASAWPSFDGARLLADVQRICETQIAFWGCAPFERYVFLLNCVDEGGGGLEHRASTALLAARRELPRVGMGPADIPDGYANLLTLFSHEYFHAWNVKRLRPAELARYDYQHENYTELLWFFEGFTSYFDELMLLRAGLIEAPRYLKMLAKTVSGVQATPGRLRHSLAEASFEAWIKFYRPDEHTPNLTVSYYGKGALVACALDLSLRREGRSLDELMRSLWEGSEGGPIDEDDILTIAGSCANELRAWVHGTAELPLRELFERFGVAWREDAPNLAQRLGLKVSESALTGVQVKQVFSDSAALASGFSPGDELLACQGWRLRRLDDALALLPAGEKRLHFLVSRDQRLVELDCELPEVSAGMGTVQLQLADPAAAKAWLS